MIRLKRFRMGGIHPPGYKLSAGSPIEPALAPEEVVLPLSQHIGAPAQPVVQKGDRVKVGTLIAKAGGFVSANLHAPVSGTVTKIEAIPDGTGYRRESIVIAAEGDEWEERIDRTDALESNIPDDGKAIVAKIAEAGVVGLGGATFPTQVKLSPPPGSRAELLVINGAECEPYLTADHRLMLEKSAEIIVGIRLLMKAIGVQRAVVGIENNKEDAIAAMRAAAASCPEITVTPLRTQYPQGGEKQLIDAVTGRQVPSGALPIATGAVVQNVGTAFAVYEAVQKNKPLVERVVTVTGPAVGRPANLRVRIGTPMARLIEQVGGIPEGTGKIVSGGPMMGKALVTTDIPVTKGCSGILLLPRESALRGAVQPCIRCAKCISVCPMGLTPYLLMQLSENDLWERSLNERATDCIECGSCSYTCPANRPLLDYIRLGKAKASAILRNRASK